MVKTLAFGVAPRLAAAVSSSRARRRSQMYVKEWGLFDLNQRLISAAGDRVLEGPFKGLRLTASAQREHVGPFVLGTYEAELIPWWDQLVRQQFGQIIDVGAKFGYYAVGLARYFPRASVIAFDTDWWARRATREMAEANSTPNVFVSGYCSPAWFAAHLSPNALIVSDCEGAEGQLYCTRWVPQFATATFVIELHEDFVPGVTEAVREKFRGTHRIHEVDSVAERPAGEARWSLTRDELRRVAEEVRGAQKWMMLTPRSA